MDTTMMETSKTATQPSTSATHVDNSIAENPRKRVNMVADGEEEVEDNNNNLQPKLESLSISSQTQTVQTPGLLPAKKRRKKVGVTVPMMNGGTMNWWKYGSMQKDYIQHLANKNPGLLASTTAKLSADCGSGTNFATSHDDSSGDVNGTSNSLRVVSNDNLSVSRAGYSTQQAAPSDNRGGFTSIIQALQSKVGGGGGNITIPPHLLQQASSTNHSQPTAGPSSILQSSSSSSSLRNAAFPPADAIDLQQQQTIPRRIANAFFRPEQAYTDAYQQDQVEGGMGIGMGMIGNMGAEIGTARVGDDHNQFVGYDGGEEEEDHDDCSEDSNALKFRAYQAENWTERFEEIIEFRNLFGHCLVPNAFPENPALAQWVKRQRYQKKLKLEGKRSTMSDERVTALEEIGFVWDSHSAVWSERLQDLIDYKRVHGHCNVPSRYAENKQLAIWVKRQRRQFKFYCEKKPSAMTDERINRLNAIGFEWDLKVKK